MKKGWALDKGAKGKTFCPIEVSQEGYRLSVGLSFIGQSPPNGEEVIGEFCFDEDGELIVTIYKEARRKNGGG